MATQITLKQLFSKEECELPNGKQALAFNCDFTNQNNFEIGPQSLPGARSFTGIRGIFITGSVTAPTVLTIKVNGTGQIYTFSISDNFSLSLPLICLEKDMVSLSMGNGTAQGFLTNFGVDAFGIGAFFITNPQNTPAIPNEFLTSYNSVTGEFSQAQPVVSGVIGAAPLASPDFTGVPIAPTAAPLTNDTQIATTAYTDAAVSVEKTRAENAESLLAPLASPDFTGIVGIGGNATSTTPLSIISSVSGLEPALLRMNTNIGNSYSLEMGVDSIGYGFVQSVEQGVSFNVPLAINPNGGDVGIGTKNPTSLLDVNGAITAQGIILSAATIASSSTAGTATALPATPAGYLEQSINGTTYKIPYYNV